MGRPPTDFVMAATDEEETAMIQQAIDASLGTVDDAALRKRKADALTDIPNSPPQPSSSESRKKSRLEAAASRTAPDTKNRIAPGKLASQKEMKGKWTKIAPPSFIQISAPRLMKSIPKALSG
jgi:hypothetical protein